MIIFVRFNQCCSVCLLLKSIFPEHHKAGETDSERKELWHGGDPGAHHGGERRVEEAGGPGGAASQPPAGGAQLLPVLHGDGRRGGMAAGRLPPGLQRGLWPRRILHSVAAKEAQGRDGGHR